MRPVVWVPIRDERLSPEAWRRLRRILEPVAEVVGPDLPEALEPRVVALLVFKFREEVPLERLRRLRSLRWIQAITAGVDHIVKEPLPEGVQVLHTPSPNADAIAEHVLALLLAAAKRIVFHTEAMRRGAFPQGTESRRLKRATLLVVGLGNIGCEVARRARCLGMRVIGIRRRPRPKCGVRAVYPLAQLLQVLPRADAVVLALPLTPETEGLIGKEALNRMKPDAILVNVARGRIVDAEALYRHLQRHPNFVVALDVWWRYPAPGEPFQQPVPLETLPNVIMTPHVAPVVPGFLERMVLAAARRLRRKLAQSFSSATPERPKGAPGGSGAP